MQTVVGSSTSALETPPLQDRRRRLTVRQYAGRTVLYAVLHVAVAWLARQLPLSDAGFALIWPAAAVAMLWLRASWRRRWSAVDVTVLFAVTAACNDVTGATLPMSIVFAGANTLMAMATVEVWRLLRPGPPGRLHSAGDLSVLLLAAAVGAVVSAPLVAAGPVLTGERAEVGLPALLLGWIARNTLSAFAFSAVALVIRDRRMWERLPRTSARWDRWEVAALVIFSLVVHVTVFGSDSARAGTFLVLPFSVWAAMRFSPGAAAVHGLASALTGVLATLAGRGPIRFDEPVLRLVYAQAFMAVVILMTLLLALSRLEAHRFARRAQQEAEQAQAASHAKTMFLAQVSHELRTPLTSVLGYTDLLLESLHERVASCRPAVERRGGAAGTAQLEEDLEYAGLIRSSGAHLLAMINDILDVTRAETGQLRLQTAVLPLGSLIDGVVDMLGPMGVKAGVRVATARSGSTAAVDVEVLADADRLRQVLINLGTNAVLYNRPGGSVTLTWELQPRPNTGRVGGQSSEGVAVRIVDTGVGIEPHDLERLFRPFERASSSAQVEGLGIGLPLSRLLAEAMGGLLLVESHPGVGSTFTLWLPLARNREAVRGPDAESVSAKTDVPRSPDRGGSGDAHDGLYPRPQAASQDTSGLRARR